MKLLIHVFAFILITTQLAFAAPPEKGLASYYDDSFHGRKTASSERYDKNKLTAAHKTLPFGTKVRVYNPTNKKSVEVVINDRGPYIKGRVIELSKKAAQQIGLVKAGVAQVEITVLSSKSTKPAVAAAASTKKPAAKPNAAKPSSKPKTAAKAVKKTTKTPKSNPNMIAKAQKMEKGGLYKIQVLKFEAPKGYGVQVAGYSDYQAVVQQVAVFQKNWFKGINVFVDERDGKPYYKIILGPMTTKEQAASYCQSIKSKYKIKDAFVVDVAKLTASKK